MRAVLLFAVSALLPSALCAQDDKASARALAEVIARSPHVHGDVLCLKLVEGSGAECVGGRLRSRIGMDLRPVMDLLDRAGARIEPLFTAMTWEELDRWHARAVAVCPPGKAPGHLGLWFRVTLPSAAVASSLWDPLWQHPLVAHVENEAIPTPASAGCAPPVPGDLPPPTPSFTSIQYAHEASPTGHGIWSAQSVYGARGQGLAIRMVEWSWNFGHEDIHQDVASNCIGPVAPPDGNENHGVAGASIVCADRNGYGMTGIVDEAGIRFIAQSTNGGIFNAMLVAGANSQPGDVVMFVLMFMLGQLGVNDWVPYEILQPMFDATLTLTSNGRYFVGAAGNGANNLDDPRFLRRFDLTYRDSGGYLIGASDGALMTRAAFSNYGSRIDAHSHGDNVMACGYGTLFYPNNDINQSYTLAYTGTSSATALMTGVVGSIVAGVHTEVGRFPDVHELRQWLRTHGPLSPDGIGRRPDVRAVLAAAGALDGLELARPDVPLGGSAQLLLSGPAGAGAFVFANFAPGSTDLGLNRKVLLGLSGILSMGFVPMPTGSAAIPVAIPNDPGLRGLSLYFQAGLLVPAAPIHVTNAGQLTVL